ncbi:MAG: DUF4838 domain-containing protein [Spirochaetaceae bacterium]|jgi:hypothetical protein|nr:DUF4838 domain-containing protein [Spirochaetaceae bacterium]
MIGFDVSKEWAITVSPDTPNTEKAAGELSHYIGLLRRQAGLSQKPPALKRAGEKAPDSGYCILLAAQDQDRDKNGFSWRFRKDRLEIDGESDRGLYRGVFDFLGALGFRWPGPDKEELPPLAGAKPPEYALKESYASHPSGQDTIRRRLIFPAPSRKDQKNQNLKPLITWAGRNQIDTLVFSLRTVSLAPASGPGERQFFSKTFAKRCKQAGTSAEELLALAERWAMTVELGGWDLSFLVPRRYFLFHRDMFRMDSGQRDKRHNFCPTAPDTIKTLQAEAGKLFQAHPEIKVYHLWPDAGHEKAWCSCPTCRAFTLEEQNRIAVNAAADALAKINPAARLSFYENPSRKGNIEARANLFRIQCLPGEAGAEEGGWFLSG